MRLKSIKLAGFKSFVDPTTVQARSPATELAFDGNTIRVTVDDVHDGLYRDHNSREESEDVLVTMVEPKRNVTTTPTTTTTTTSSLRTTTTTTMNP